MSEPPPNNSLKTPFTQDQIEQLARQELSGLGRAATPLELSQRLREIPNVRDALQADAGRSADFELEVQRAMDAGSGFTKDDEGKYDIT